MGLLAKNRTGDGAIGAIAGDAGKGAGAGAIAGTMRGGMQQSQANAAAQNQAGAQTAAKQQKEEEELKAAHAEGLDTFQRAFEACMDARACRSPDPAPPRAYSRCVGLLAFVDKRPRCWRKG